MGTHRRSITTTPGWIEGMLAIRYPPFTDDKLKQFRKMQDMKPDFDRQGNPTGGLVWWLIGLGGRSKTSAAALWITKGSCEIRIPLRLVQWRWRVTDRTCCTMEFG